MADVHMSGDGSISADGSIFMLLDADANSTGSAFVVKSESNLSSAATELFRVNENGNVGIGTSTPTYNLDVVGTINLSSYVRILGNAALKWDSVNNTLSVGSQSVGGVSLQSRDVDDALVVAPTGRVGIGTTSPGSKLHVANGGLLLSASANDAFSSNIRFDKDRAGGATQNGDELGYLSFRGHDGSAVIRGATIVAKQSGAASANSLPTDLIFATNAGAADALERMRITSSGNVGIGTANPSSSLTVSGTIESTSGGIKFPDGSVQTTASFDTGTASLNTSGYQRLPSGLIMQWGTLTEVSLNQTFHSLTFPMAFPNAVLNIQATIHRTTIITGTVAPVIRNVTTTGAQIAGDYDTNTSTGDIQWFAIGY